MSYSISKKASHLEMEGHFFEAAVSVVVGGFRVGPRWLRWEEAQHACICEARFPM